MDIVYSLSFAELCDRAQIVTLKITHSKEPNESFEKELDDILHDIQLHLDSKPINSQQVKGLIVLGMVNKFIWDNESFVRDADDNGNVPDEELLARLKLSHKANSLRAAAKKHIQSNRSERVDEKLNYGLENNFWNIKWQ